MMPNRYSRPIAAPLSRPNRSPARSPKSPAPSGRRNRCVTRNALEKRGTRSVVGRPINVKSGCDSFRSLSGSSSGACAGAAAFCAAVVWGHAATSRVQASRTLVQRMDSLLIVVCTKLDPPLDDEDLATAQKRSIERHPSAHDPCTALDLVNEIAGVGVPRCHSKDARSLDAGPVHEVAVRDRIRQVEAVEQTANRIVALRARDASARVSSFEDVLLNAAESGFEVRRRAGQVGEFLVAPGDSDRVQ